MSKSRIVFVGDSITECGAGEDEENLGTGYVRILHDYLQTTYPNSFEVLNKGVSGNRVTDLVERGERDIIEMNPDILSISIGVNDVWRQLDNPNLEQVFPEDFERIYDELLTSVHANANATLVLMEPTIIEEDIQSIGNQKLKAYVEIIQRLSVKYQAMLVRTHRDFITYLTTNSEYPLTIDGVHMNSAGNMLMTTGWLKTVEPYLKMKWNTSYESK